MHLLHWNILVMPYAQSTGAVISGNFSNALLTWCRMASLKLCCSLQPLLNQDWLWWCFNTLLHCCALPTEVKVSSVLQVPPGWVFPAFAWKTIHLWPWKVCSTLPCRFPSCGGGPRPCFLLCDIPTLAKDKHLTDHLPTVFSGSTVFPAKGYLPLCFSSFSL